MYNIKLFFFKNGHACVQTQTNTTKTKYIPNVNY